MLCRREEGGKESIKRIYIFMMLGLVRAAVFSSFFKNQQLSFFFRTTLRGVEYYSQVAGMTEREIESAFELQCSIM